MSENWIFKLGVPPKASTLSGLGGKGSQLAELAAMRYRVPPGFVITASAFEHVWNSNSGLLRQCEDLMRDCLGVPGALQAVASEMRDIVGRCKVPSDLSRELEECMRQLHRSHFAVRSSAGAEDGQSQSFAGMFDTYLNVAGQDVPQAVLACWGSQFTARSVAYRFAQKEHSIFSADFAVIVQEVIASEISGVTFTRHPSSSDPDSMLIEAVWGLGEALVGGEVIPDSYVINKSAGIITETRPSPQARMRSFAPAGGTQWVGVEQHRAEQRKLDDRTICELAALCSDLERTFGYPCDIEWAIARGTIYVLQCRPITVAAESFEGDMLSA